MWLERRRSCLLMHLSPPPRSRFWVKFRPQSQLSQMQRQRQRRVCGGSCREVDVLAGSQVRHMTEIRVLTCAGLLSEVRSEEGKVVK